MPHTLNGHVPTQLKEAEHRYDDLPTLLNSPNSNNEKPPESDDWSYATKDLLDTLPQVWTRGLLYFLVVFVSIVLPWAMLSKVDETGTAIGRLEPKGKTIRLDAPVAGTVVAINVKEGERVEAGQSLVKLESELVRAELQQLQTKLSGQEARLNQLNLLKNQLAIALDTHQQQNQAQQLEKQAQVEQARQKLEYSRAAYKLANIRLNKAQREVQRYRKLWKQGVIPEIQVVEKEDLAQERQGLQEQAQTDVEQAQLRLQEQQRSYKGLVHSGKLAMLKSEEELQNLETEITTLIAEIAQTKKQSESLAIQLAQRELKAPGSGTVFQLPIQKAGAVVQPGTMVAEIAPKGSPLIIRAQMATTESGSLQKGLPVKLKFDAYPFQDYGVVEGKLVEISPTTTQLDTPNGKAAAYNLEIALERHCVKSGNKCIPLRPGDTATAEVIVRQRRIIDFLLDPFKNLQQGGLKL